jgi:hypothetical protein
MASDGRLDDALEMWTVTLGFEAPPESRYRARRWLIRRGEAEPVPTETVLVASSLDGVRSMLPWGLCVLPRSEGHDPSIVETWF